MSMPDTTQPDNKTIAQEIYKRNRELLEQRRRTEQLLYSVSEAVVAVDKNLNITFLNSTAERIFKIKSDETLGKPVHAMIKIQTEKGIPINPDEYCFNDVPAKEETNYIVLTAPDRTYYINLKSRVVDPETSDECVLTITDITQQIELEKTKDEFIYVTSHELRTPITIIKSYLWMMQSAKGGGLSDKQKEYVEKAARGTERLLALINDTLSISRIENGKTQFVLEDINLKPVITEMSADFKVKTDEKGLKLLVDVPEELKHVKADKNKIRELFINYFGNSIKFTSVGSITIKAENIVKPLGDYVRVSIIDTGKGVAKENLNKLFLKFGRIDSTYQTVAESSGTGLGLYIVKTMVEAMGGSVGADSAGIDKGASFWFELPAVETISTLA